jgi:glycerate kinase
MQIRRQGATAALAAPDKFRGSLTAAGVAAAIAAGARRAALSCRELPLGDGGEGTLDALGGSNRTTVVSGPLGEPVEAGWRLADGTAVIEMARASGLALVGGAAGNDAVRASTKGTGELIEAALAAGAEQVIVAVGGSATTDGGLGAVDVLRARGRFRVPVRVACDVETAFLDAPEVFGPQKGATAEDVGVLSERLAALAERYRDELGVDVTALRGAGAAGGLAGGLAALGAELVPGFDLVAAQVGLEPALAGVDLVITGEGRLDPTSFAGKVVGGLLRLCAERNVPALVVTGEIAAGTECPVPAISLVEVFGRRRAWAEPGECVAEAVAGALGAKPATGRGSGTAR